MAVDHERVRSLLAEGRSRAAVAQKVGCHPTTVWRIAREAAAAQPSLGPCPTPRPADTAAPRASDAVGLDRVRELRRETARLRAELELRETERTLQAYERRAREEDDRELVRAEHEARQRRDEERHQHELLLGTVRREQEARAEQQRRAVAAVVKQLRRDGERFQREMAERAERTRRADAAHVRIRDLQRRLAGPAGRWWNCVRCGDEFLAEGTPGSCTRCAGVLSPRV